MVYFFSIEVFEQVFRLHNVEKEKLKVITLLFDLLHERNEIENQANSRNEAVIEKLRQYRQVPLIELLVDKGFCSEIAKLLKTAKDFDGQEKILRTIGITVDQCATTFRSLKKDFIQLQNSFQSSLNEDKDNEYIQSLIVLIDEILPKLKLYDEL